jgi:DNA-binding transcriptional MerR regulator
MKEIRMNVSTLNPTQSHPYATPYVCQLFQIQESTLKNLSQVLKLTPQMDSSSQQLHFTQADLDILKQAIELHRQGKPLSEIVPMLITPPASTALQVAHSYSLNEATPLEMESAPSGISSVVQAITHSKEYILNEMSRLLDDRLAGLDEVVVELIRTKSENDALRSKINTLTREKQALLDEVESFKPVQFGFYKKVRK